VTGVSGSLGPHPNPPKGKGCLHTGFGGFPFREALGSKDVSL